MMPVPMDPLNIQTGIIASVITNLLEEKDEKKLESTRSALGFIFRLFNSVAFLRGIAFFLVFLSFFFQMPVWCYRMGNKIAKDCSIDIEQNEYYVMKLLSFKMWNAYYISWGCQAFLILNQVFAIFFAKERSYIFRVLGLVICLAGDIFTGILFMTNVLNYSINPFFKIAFLIIYSQTLRKGVIRLFMSLKDSIAAIFIFSLNVTVFSGLAFILFYGKMGITRCT